MLRQIRSKLSFTNVILALLGGGFMLVVVIGTIVTLSGASYTSRDWFNLIVAGLAQGGIYALIALGYTLVYGILKMINFAHSEVYMSGALTGYFVADAFRSAFQGTNFWDFLLALLAVLAVAMLTSIIVAVLLERIAYRPLRRAPRLVPLITAIGASYFLLNVFRGLYGSQNRAYPEVTLLRGEWSLWGEFTIRPIQALVIVAAGLLMVALYILVQLTRTGKAMRAVSEDKDAAALMGINVDAIIVRTFVIGAALAGAAGVLYALMFRQVSFSMGFVPGIKAFTAAVLGGIGNIPGAMLGGIFLGLFEAVGPSLFLNGLGIPAPYQLKDVIAFSMLVLVLIFRPQGLLGERLGKTKA